MVWSLAIPRSTPTSRRSSDMVLAPRCRPDRYLRSAATSDAKITVTAPRATSTGGCSRSRQRLMCCKRADLAGRPASLVRDSVTGPAVAISATRPRAARRLGSQSRTRRHPPDQPDR
jgi:hypothetical protein